MTRDCALLALLPKMDNTTFSLETEQPELEGLSDYKHWYPWMATINTLLITCGIPGNLLTIAAYWKYGKNMRTPTNILIVSQSVGDLFTSLTTPLMVFFHYTLAGRHVASTYRYACLTGLVTVIISAESSATNLLLLSIERFIAVRFSLEYYNWVTERRVCYVVISVWFLVLSLNCLPLFGLNTWHVGASCWPFYVYYQVHFVVAFVFPILFCLISIAILSVLVAVTAWRQAHYSTHAAGPAATPSSQPPDEAAGKKEQKIEFIITKMLLMVVGTYFACFTPALLTYFVRLKPPEAWGENGGPDVFEGVSEIFRGFIGFNAFINPLIYAHKNPQFKKAFGKLLSHSTTNASSLGSEQQSTQMKNIRTSSASNAKQLTALEYMHEESAHIPI